MEDIHSIITLGICTEKRLSNLTDHQGKVYFRELIVLCSAGLGEFTWNNTSARRAHNLTVVTLTVVTLTTNSGYTYQYTNSG